MYITISSEYVRAHYESIYIKYWTATAIFNYYIYFFCKII